MVFWGCRTAKRPQKPGVLHNPTSILAARKCRRLSARRKCRLSAQLIVCPSLCKYSAA